MANANGSAIRLKIKDEALIHVSIHPQQLDILHNHLSIAQTLLNLSEELRLTRRRSGNPHPDAGTGETLHALDVLIGDALQILNAALNPLTAEV